MSATTYNILTTLMIGLTFSSCETKPGQVSHSKENAKPVSQSVTTYQTKLESITESIRLNGQIEHNPDQVVHYASLISGVITKMYFSLGDKVNKGQVLAKLKSSELTDLTSQKSTFESQLLVAKRKLSVAESMFGDRISSEKDLVEAQSEVDILKSEIEKIQSNLSLYNASTEKGVFQIKAPVSGYVVQNNISGGTQISSGADLFTISDLSDVWVTTNVYAMDLPFVQKGMVATIKSKAYPGEAFEGIISEISQVFDPQERVLKARIRMPNKDLKLKPGLAIEAVVKKNTKEFAIGVPANALIFHNNENYLLIQKPDGTLEPRKVIIDAKDNDKVFFKNGLSAGENIVINNQLLLFSDVINLGK